MIRKVLFSLICLSVVVTALGQEQLPQLPVAPEITLGTLPNGIQYYFVTNKAEPGYADFSLIQKGHSHPDVSGLMKSLPHFTKRSPEDFLVSHGVAAPVGGYASGRGGHTVFDFRSVPLSNQSVTDSTMLLLMDLASTCPTGQAIVISGDIALDKFKDRLSLLSMTVGRRGPAPVSDAYIWTPTEVPACYYSENRSSALSSLRITYSSARVPKDRMNTLQPVVTRQYSTYLGMILERRIRENFRVHDIPLADLEYRYRDSSTGSGDEIYTITVTTSASSYESAVRQTAAILADIDTRGATLPELQEAKDRLVSQASRDAGNIRYTNADYVRKCANSYLYDASLVSDATINDFFGRSRLPGEQELGLFNSFASALLDVSNNIILGFDTPRAVVRLDLLRSFESEWRRTAEDPSATFGVARCDTTFNIQPYPKVRLVSEASEPVSGGMLWTFSNGMRVIFKHAATKGEFQYDMILRGGSSLVKGLLPGENAFVGDMLDLCDVDGRRNSDFRSILSSNGITYNTSVSLSDLQIRGKAPKGSVTTLLEALLALATSRHSIRPEDFAYYKACESLRLEQRRLSLSGVIDKVDSLIAPTSRYVTWKNISALRNDLPQRACDFFDAQFGNCSDGVLVLVGDLNEETLKKSLCNYLGGFPTDRKKSTRPRASGSLIAGTTTHSSSARDGVGDGLPLVCVEMAAPTNFNGASFAAWRVACLALEDCLAGPMLEVGASCEVTFGLSLYPQEIFKVYLVCRPGKDPYAALEAIRKALKAFRANPYQVAGLASYKTDLLALMNGGLATSEGCIDAVAIRYSENKDLVTSYRNASGSLTEAAVAAAIDALVGGSRVEYVCL